MKKRYTEAQIINILNEADSGIKVADLCRKHNISNATYYAWKAKFGGMTISDAKRLRELEEENRNLKRLVADQALDLVVLKDIVAKKW